MNEFVEQNEALIRLQTQLEELRNGAETIDEFLKVAEQVFVFASQLKTENEELLKRTEHAVERLETSSVTVQTESHDVLSAVRSAAQELSTMLVVLNDLQLPVTLNAIQTRQTRMDEQLKEIHETLKTDAQAVTARDEALLRSMKDLQSNATDHQKHLRAVHIRQREIVRLLKLIRMFSLTTFVAVLVAVVALVALVLLNI